MRATDGANGAQTSTISSPPNTQNLKDQSTGVNVYRVCNDLGEEMSSTVNLSQLYNNLKQLLGKTKNLREVLFYNADLMLADPLVGIRLLLLSLRNA